LKRMLKITMDILQAQDFLKEKYGESDYRKMIHRLQTKIVEAGGEDVELAVLNDIATDETVGPVVRLVAITAMGEEKI
jgi:hypothetical protein